MDESAVLIVIAFVTDLVTPCQAHDALIVVERFPRLMVCPLGSVILLAGIFVTAKHAVLLSEIISAPARPDGIVTFFT